MAVLRFTPAALGGLERLAPLILDGLRILGAHPLIGRPIDARRRELVIFRGRQGYVAQYSFRPAQDEVVVLAIRHQRELDG